MADTSRKVTVPVRLLRALEATAEDCMAATYRTLRDTLTETVPRAKLGDDALASERRAREVVSLAQDLLRLAAPDASEQLRLEIAQ